MRKKIVVWDPQRAIPEGDIQIEGANLNRAELMRQIVALPYEDDLRDFGGVGGFAKKGFGYGVSFDGMQARRDCPLLVATPHDGRRLFWAARLTQHEAHPQGTLRLTAYPNSLSSVACSAVPMDGPIDLAALGPMDQWNGWTVRGVASLSCPTSGYVCVGLQGIAQHLRVLWFAASVVRYG